MIKSMRVFALTTLSLFLVFNATVLGAQVSNADIQKEIEIETEMQQKLLIEAEQIQRRIRELEAKNNPQDKIDKLIATNDTQALLREFDKYAQRLDNFLIQDPFQADTLLAFVKKLYRDVYIVQDQIHYYTGAVAYYRNDDMQALNHLERFFSLYPDSNASPRVLAMILKVLISLNQEAKAERDYLQKYAHISSPEIKYLSAHILFNLSKDSQALALFSELSQDNTYGTDSSLMVNLINSLNQPTNEALTQFQTIDTVTSNNPFVILALARLYVLNSQWDKAEAQYQRFYSIYKDNRASFSQYEMILSLLNSGKRSEAIQKLDELIQRKDIGEFYTTFLYLWADLKMEDGNASIVNAKFQEFQSVIENTRVLIPQKLPVLNRVNEIKQELYNNPETSNFANISQRMIAVGQELSTIHATLAANPGVLPLNTLSSLHKYELEIINQYLTLFENYSKTHMRRYVPNELGLKFVDIYKQMTDQNAQIISNLENMMSKMESEDLRLQRQNEIERNIAVKTEVLSTIEQLKETRPDYVVSSTDVDRYKAELAELIELRDFYNYDNTLYHAAKQAIEDFQEDKVQADLFIPFANEKFSKEVPAREVDRELRDFRAMIDKPQVISDWYNRVIIALSSRFDKSLLDMDLIKLHIDYAALIKRDKARAGMSFENSKREQDLIIGEMQSLSRRIVSFMEANPDINALNQPMDFGKLFSKANLYYYLAELDFAINRNVYTLSTLNFYRKVLEEDPSFYMKDAVLYNVAYISAYLLQTDIEVRKESFWANNPTALVRPAELRETEAYYAEAIAAYTQLIENYPTSAYRNDALYRMGLLHFDIGSDAEQPVLYYAKARESYFNLLIDDQNAPQRYEAMYQRGWTFINSNDEESMFNALGDFMTILTAIEDNKITDPVTRADFTDASISNIAYALIAVDGANYEQSAKGALYIENRMKDFVDYKLILGIIDEAIKMKRELLAPMQVTDFMFTRINLEPKSIQNPLRLKEILQVYYSNQRLLRGNADIREIQYDTYLMAKRMFNQDSEWYIANKDQDIQEQLAFIKEAYDNIEIRLNNACATDPNITSYQAYKEHLNDYIKFSQLQGENYTAWKLSRQQNLLVLGRMLAEKTSNPIYYIEAINQSYAFNDANPENPDFFINEALAYQMTEYVHDNLADSTFALAAANQGIPADPNAMYAIYKNAAQRYAAILISEKYKNPENTQTFIALVNRLGNLELKRGDYAAADQTFRSALVIENELPGANRRDLYLQLAQISDQKKDRVASEEWFRKAQTYALNEQDRNNFTLLAQEQISKSINEAEGSQDYVKAGNEYLRLATEYEQSDPAKKNAFKLSASGAFKNAKDYQKSIDLIIEVAGDFQDIDDVYALYAEAWIMADSLKNDPDQSRSLKDQFMSKYPSSIQTYAMRVQRLELLEKQPGKKQEAVDQYLVLHDDVRNKRIDSGENKSEDIFLKAVVMSADNESKMYQLMEQFTTLYPGHNKNLDFVEAMAVNAEARGDSLRFRQLAKEVYTKDKNRNSHYQRIAEKDLKVIYDDFSRFYDNKEWQKAFTKRDEFKKVEAAYVKEGLKFTTEAIYTEFAAVEKEHKDLQDKLAFLRSYDTQLAALEKGFLAKKPADLLRVTAVSKWENHIAGGENRVAALKKLADAEAAKVVKLRDGAKGKGLDIGRIAKTYNLHARIYEHGEKVVRTQIDYFLANATQIKDERNSPDYQATLDFLNGQKEQFASVFVREAYLVHLDLYDLVYMAGYRDKNTEHTLKKLTEWEATPDYIVDTYALDGTWQIQLKAEDGTMSSIGQVGKITSPMGEELSTLTIPSKQSLIMKKLTKHRALPYYGYAQLVYPYDAKISINSKKISPVYTAIDTLDASKPGISTRYAVLLNRDSYQLGENVIEFELPNLSADPLSFGFAMKLLTDRQELEQSVPLETMTIITDNKWKASAPDSTGVLQNLNISVATAFKVNNLDIRDLEQSKAIPIWASETPELPINEIVFETEFTVDTEFRSGFMVFAAPEYVTVILNDIEIENEFMFDYDPDPMYVYPYRYDFAAADIKQGKNTLKLIVKNQSEFRGLVGEINIVKTGKEGGI